MTTIDHGEMSGETVPLSATKWVTPDLLRYLRIYHCDIVVDRRTHLSRGYVEEIRRAEDLGIVRRNSDMEIANSLVTLRGYRETDGVRVWAVFETSVSIRDIHVELVRQRADILAVVYSEPALAVIVGESIQPSGLLRAAALGVTLFAAPHRKASWA